MSKKTTIYNKSEKAFVLSKDLTIKAKSHKEIDSELAETLCKRYPRELTTVKTPTNDAENAKLEEARAKIATELKDLDKAKADFEAEKEAFKKEKEAFEKSTKK